MSSFVDGQERSIGGQGEVNTRETIHKNQHVDLSRAPGHHVRNQVGLELVQINVERSIESQRTRDRRDNLGNESVQIGETREADTEFLLANVVNSLIIHLEEKFVSAITFKKW